MNLLPSEKIELQTELSIQEVRNILKKNIRPKKGLTFGYKRAKDDKQFEGTFELDEFKIRRIIYGQNSFSPQIKGRIQSQQNGTKLIAHLKIHKLSLIFLIFWMAFVGFTFVVGIIGVINQKTNPILLIFPLILIVFSIGLVHYGFITERQRSVSELKKMIVKK